MELSGQSKRLRFLQCSLGKLWRERNLFRKGMEMRKELENIRINSKEIEKESLFLDELLSDKITNTRNNIEFYKGEKDMFLDRITIKLTTTCTKEISNVLANEDIEFDYAMARSYYKKLMECQIQLKALEQYLYP